MNAVTILVCVVTLGAVGYALWVLRSLREEVSGILQDVIAKEIRLQDDRIQHRVSRADRQTPDTSETDAPLTDGVIGRPYRKR